MKISERYDLYLLLSLFAVANRNKSVIRSNARGWRENRASRYNKQVINNSAANAVYATANVFHRAAKTICDRQ